MSMMTDDQTTALTAAFATLPKKQTLHLSDYTDEMLALDALAAMDDGEWTAEHEELAERLAVELAQKTDAVWSYRLTIKRDAEAAKEAASALAQKAKRLAERIEWLDGYILREMERSGRPVLKGTLYEVRQQKNSAPTVIVDVLPAELPAEYVRVIPEVREPNKTAIADAIKAGHDIIGCRLEYGVHLRAK